MARPHPDVVVVEETASPTGIPRHAYETPVFAVREGVDALRFDSWPRIDDALASYAVFRDLRSQGVIPDGLRFQVGLPFPASALNAFRPTTPATFPRLNQVPMGPRELGAAARSATSVADLVE